jgi:DNA-binding MarR family transcriptional regulator
MAPSFVDLTPDQAVEEAKKLASGNDPTAWEALDRCLRHRLLELLRGHGRTGSKRLRRALLAACRWSEAEEKTDWHRNWTYLLELLRDADSMPSLAGDLEALGRLEGRAAGILRLLVDRGRPLRPKEVAESLGLSPQQVSNVCRRLDERDLLVRRKGEGRATWMFPTARGRRTAALVPEPPAPSPDEGAPVPLGMSPWHQPSLAAPVAIR